MRPPQLAGGARGLRRTGLCLQDWMLFREHRMRAGHHRGLSQIAQDESRPLVLEFPSVPQVDGSAACLLRAPRPVGLGGRKGGVRLIWVFLYCNELGRAAGRSAGFPP